MWIGMKNMTANQYKARREAMKHQGLWRGNGIEMYGDLFYSRLVDLPHKKFINAIRKEWKNYR